MMVNDDHNTHENCNNLELLQTSIYKSGSFSSALSDASRLPCLYSNISTEISPCSNDKSSSDNLSKPKTGNNKLSTQHKKSATILTMSVGQMADKYTLEKLGFLTLTFSDNVLDARVAWKRFNSLATHVLRKRYRDYICVMERQKSGRIHFHLVIALDNDIRTGFDFQAIGYSDYSSAGKVIRSEWSFWRKTAKKYHFGRTELLPIKSTAAGIAKYVGKYISKAIDARITADKGVNLVSYSNGARAGNTRFAFVSDNSARWRVGVAAFAQFVAARHGLKSCSYEQLQVWEGKRWAFTWRDLIIALGTSV